MSCCARSGGSCHGCARPSRASTPPPSTRPRSRQSIAQLDELFLLVIVGEFNAGKSAFINALAWQPHRRGGGHADDGADQRPASTASRRTPGARPSLHVITAPVQLLRDIHIVDTPGTNAIIREHERITAEFVPRSDLVLFVTSADRPFTETERAFLEQVRGWGKKVVIVINKIDILEDERRGRRRSARSSPRARTRLLGFDPGIFPVSAKLALRAKQGDPPPGRRAASRRSSATSARRSTRPRASSSSCSTRSASAPRSPIGT